MPGKVNKHVRFAYKNIFHSPPPAATPALSFSTSTVPSSLGPITPPSMAMGLPGPSPYSYTPSYPPVKTHTHPAPSRHSGPVRLHPYLEPNAITWDLMDHPSIMSRNHHSISSRALCEAATSQPLSSIRITSPYLPWTIKVHASNGSYITLEDVFNSIHRSLRTNITQSEFSSFPSEGDQRRATRAYEQRYRRQRSTRHYEEEKRGGMKRVDFLMGRSRFFGISNAGRRPDEWQLNVT
ncbi:hypothetical protein CVT25_006907 [Psilocybe cyanescens]|uniref:DUF6699 domain-containing protein n=1 Tax=Psilocybe cyanescens TaxID=93625 RepID=A0A409X5Y9_PSICY|nr:hypothetical protein CVT25_006907 [Psilocybe cyanescens]